jgi:NAD-dependent SIR2 family protein deacetylase
METSSLIEQCAQTIHKAKRMVFLTSAGMSADSNIPTFRDKEGYWSNFPPFKEKGLEAQDLASPWAFRNELPHAWAFYEWRRRNAHENQPHAGYTIINKWIEERLEDAFIHTTNTDGYHLRSGCPPDKVKEVHGSMWRLQCLNVCSPDFWDEDAVPLCDLDHDTMKASNYPTCPHCGGIARPHILMFGDGEYTGHPEQERNFYAFARRAVDVVVLVGSSGAVPTNDYLAREFMRAGAETININLDPSANAIVGTEYFLPLKGKEVFERLDAALQAL